MRAGIIGGTGVRQPVNRIVVNGDEVRVVVVICGLARRQRVGGAGEVHRVGQLEALARGERDRERCLRRHELPHGVAQPFVPIGVNATVTRLLSAARLGTTSACRLRFWMVTDSLPTTLGFFALSATFFGAVNAVTARLSITTGRQAVTELFAVTGSTNVLVTVAVAQALATAGSVGVTTR